MASADRWRIEESRSCMLDRATPDRKEGIAEIL